MANFFYIMFWSSLDRTGFSRFLYLWIFQKEYVFEFPIGDLDLDFLYIWNLLGFLIKYYYYNYSYINHKLYIKIQAAKECILPTISQYIFILLSWPLSTVKIFFYLYKQDCHPKNMYESQIWDIIFHFINKIK